MASESLDALCLALLRVLRWPARSGQVIVHVNHAGVPKRVEVQYGIELAEASGVGPRRFYPTATGVYVVDTERHTRVGS